MKNDIYVLVYEINEYNQEGAYFEHAWCKKPTKEDVRKLNINLSDEELDIIMKSIDNKNINTRINNGYIWYRFIVLNGDNNEK